MSKQITAIIVDDEQDARDGLERQIVDLLPDVNIIAKAENAQNALEIIIDEHPNLVFLDIQMPVNDGFWLANKLNKLKNGTSIIFVTAYDEYAIKAIKYAAFDFLTKPVIPELLKESVERYAANNDNMNLNQKLNIYNGFIMVSPADIVYCEAEKNYCNIYLLNGKKEFVTSQLAEVEKKLAENSFVKISRSAIINLNYLETYNRKTKTVILSVIIQKFELKVSSSGEKRLLLL